MLRLSHSAMLDCEKGSAPNPHPLPISLQQQTSHTIVPKTLRCRAPEPPVDGGKACGGICESPADRWGTTLWPRDVVVSWWFSWWCLQVSCRLLVVVMVVLVAMMVVVASVVTVVAVPCHCLGVCTGRTTLCRPTILHHYNTSPRGSTALQYSSWITVNTNIFIACWISRTSKP